MVQRKTSAHSFTLSLRYTIQRSIAVGLVMVAVALLVLQHIDHPVAKSVRTSLTDGLVPVMTVIRQPMQSLQDMKSSMGNYVAVYEENARLREENATLRQWQSKALHYEVQNQALRDLLAFNPVDVTTYVTARVASQMQNPFNHSLLIDAGAKQGVKMHQVVVSADGIIGRITEVGEHSAQVLLLTDMNSRIPVQTENGIQAILAGDGTAMPRLDFLPEQAELHGDDMVLTTHHGGRVPGGLSVGALHEQNGVWRVQPAADLQRLQYVRVVDFVPALDSSQ